MKIFQKDGNEIRILSTQICGFKANLGNSAGMYALEIYTKGGGIIECYIESHECVKALKILRRLIK